jgi:ankyrin repeat protein
MFHRVNLDEKSLKKIFARCINVSQIRMTKYCLENGANPNYESFSLAALTPLQYALTYGLYDNRYDCVKMLLDYGANVNDFEAFKTAALSGRCDIVKLFLDYGVHIDIVNKTLPIILTKQHFAILELFVECGIDLTSLNQLYVKSPYMKKIERLVESGLDPLLLIAVSVDNKSYLKQ